ncbi:MAG: GntR family transcriptional regulator, partial [Vibrio metschnikovii]
MQYLAIKDIIIEQISSGQLSARQKLPSERKLAESFSTTRVTLREALSLLEAEGR